MAIASAALAACASLGERPADVATRELVARAESLAFEGRIEDALELVDRAGRDGSAAHDPFLLAFTSGWLEHRWALTRSRDERRELLARAQASYESALALRPGDADAQKNRILVLRDLGRFADALSAVDLLLGSGADARASAAAWCLKGDLLADRANPARSPSAALAAYTAGRRVARDDPAVATRVLRAHLESLDAGERRSDPAAEEAVAEEPVAAEPREAVTPISAPLDPSEAAILEACRSIADDGLRDVARSGYESLIARCAPSSGVALERWVELEARHDSLSSASLERLESGHPCRWVDSGVAELRQLLRAPRLATRDGLAYWTASASRTHALVVALHAAARAHEARGRIDDAAAIYERAWELADAQRDEHLELALDLAIFWHAHRSKADPDRAKLRALVAEAPLASFADFEAVEAAVRPRTSEERERVHTVLGLIFGEIGEWKGKAQRHLERAREISLESGRGEQPLLASTVAAGLSANVDPMASYLVAAREYVDRDATAQSIQVYEAAARYGRTSERTLRAIEDLVYPRRGWYVGISGGVTIGHVSSAELQQELADLGHQTRIDLDDQRYGEKACIGYRFDAPFALELGYTNMEGPTSTIIEQTSPPQTQQLLDDIADEHPIAGRGVTFAARYIPIQWPRVDAFVTLGGWVWDSTVDIDLHAGSASASIEKSGFDVFAGIGAEYRLSPSFSLRAEVERYELDGDPVDFLSLGVVYRD